MIKNVLHIQILVDNYCTYLRLLAISYRIVESLMQSGCCFDYSNTTVTNN